MNRVAGVALQERPMATPRYRFKHFLKIGGVMAFLTWLLATWFTPLVWPWHR